MQSPAAFVLGLYLGAVVELGGGLWVAILCHSVNNSLAVLGPVRLSTCRSPGLLWTLAGTLFAAGVMTLTWVGLRVRRRQETVASPWGFDLVRCRHSLLKVSDPSGGLRASRSGRREGKQDGGRTLGPDPGRR